MNSPASSNAGYYPVSLTSSGGVVEPPLNRTRSFDLRAWYYGGVAFLIGLVHPWTVPMVGQMPLAEFLMLGLLGKALFQCVLTSRLPPILAPRLVLFFSLAQLVALLSYVISDIYRESYPVDSVRGWLRMVFLAVDIFALAILFAADRRSFGWMQAGFAFSFFQAFVIPPIFGDYWKFGFGFPMTALVLLIGPYFFGRVGAIAALIAISGAHTALAFRSAAAACWVVAGLLALRYLPLRARQGLFVFAVIVTLAASPSMVRHTFTSESALSNRSNIERGAMLRAAWEGFASSPLIGQGSWFGKSKVLDNFLLIRKQICDESYNNGGFDHTDFEGVTIHSQILVTLAEAGVFGATFFVVYSLGLLWAIYYTIGEGAWSWLLPSRLFILVNAFWDVLMTPFSGVHRLDIALATAIVLLCWTEKREAAARRRELAR